MMPRYYFNVRDGEDRPDKVGSELPDVQAARSEAVRTAGEMLKDIDGDFEPNTTWEMTVTDEQGRTLLSYIFSASESLPSQDGSLLETVH